MFILGINAYHGDVSAVLLRDGVIVAAAEEERFRRIKHVAGFPREAIRACLAMAGITGREIDHVAVSRDPRANLGRKAWYAATVLPTGRLLRDRANNYRQVGAIPETLAEALDLVPGAPAPKIHWVEHHPAHLASTFFVSPFEDAAVCAIDGFGDFVSTSWAIGRGTRIEIIDRTFFPHSLGMVYLAMTQYLGFMARVRERRRRARAEAQFQDAAARSGLAHLQRPRGGRRRRRRPRETDDGRRDFLRPRQRVARGPGPRRRAQP